MLLHELLWLPLLSPSSIIIMDNWLPCDDDDEEKPQLEETLLEVETGENRGDLSGEMGGDSLSSWSDEEPEPPDVVRDDEPDDRWPVEMGPSEALSELFLLWCCVCGSAESFILLSDQGD